MATARTVTSGYRAGSGEPVLLLHGFTLSHHVWHAVVADLARDYDVLALTMPGHWGGRRLRMRELGVGGIADGIERDLDVLGWDTCHVVGNSLGGQVGFELERRGRARSLAAVNPGGGWTRFSWTEFRLGAGFVAQFPLAAAARVLGDRAATSERFQRPIIRNCSTDTAAVTAEDAANVLRAVSHCPVYLPIQWAFLRDGPLTDPALRRVTAPTTVMLSEFDTFLTRKKCMQRLLDALPDHVEDVVLPGVGHIPMLENPAVVAQALRAHLTRVGDRIDDRPVTEHP
ncbi:alpha/beta fold hydrolase [Prescottella sp. R16]|uniref:alpha/beta fold hydrolase n=1 Tax=Prescottella sp. R16 TaxID=3064529 RepID=UPI00272E2414|nr:alpha/beta hydrolase [Prescottella sp. R16]